MDVAVPPVGDRVYGPAYHQSPTLLLIYCLEFVGAAVARLASTKDLLRIDPAAIFMKDTVIAAVAAKGGGASGKEKGQDERDEARVPCVAHDEAGRSLERHAHAFVLSCADWRQSPKFKFTLICPLRRHEARGWRSPKRNAIGIYRHVQPRSHPATPCALPHEVERARRAATVSPPTEPLTTWHSQRQSTKGRCTCLPAATNTLLSGLVIRLRSTRPQHPLHRHDRDLATGRR